MKTKSVSLALCLTIVALGLAADQKEARPASWAQPMTLAGVPNFHTITPTLYRSAQPTAEGMKHLKEMGVATLINLRSFHSDNDEIGSTELTYEHIAMKAWHPEREDVIRFLKIVMDEKRAPVLFHCQHGADRTGTMCALYRIVVQGWSKEDAIQEMIDGGYGFHEIWQNLPKWIDELDIDSIRKELGITL
jgi:protein tyrosine/serine phosphatase